MKFRNQARIYSVVYDFEAHIMLNLFKVPDHRYWKKINSNTVAKV